MKIGLLIRGRIKLYPKISKAKCISLLGAITRATECDWKLDRYNEWSTTQYNVVSEVKTEILKTILDEYKEYLLSATIQIYATKLSSILVYDKFNKTVKHIDNTRKTKRDA